MVPSKLLGLYILSMCLRGLSGAQDLKLGCSEIVAYVGSWAFVETAFEFASQNLGD